MKRVLRNSLTAVLVVLICMSCMVVPAWAAGSTVTAEIPITVHMQGNTLPTTDTVTASIQAITAGAPMPSQSVTNVVCYGAQKQGTGSFFITYDSLGVYEYTVTVHGGDYPLAEYGEDLSFRVVVTITNNANYTGFDATVACHVGDTKCPIEDTNLYLDPLELTVVKKWVDQDSSRPASITVDLVRDGQVVEGKSLVLSARNNWQAAWTDLDPRVEWSVLERKVTGYTAKYKFDSTNNIWYITNTGSLLQTGQLNWPIPVLCIAGMSMLAMGVYMMLSKRREEHE